MAKSTTLLQEQLSSTSRRTQTLLPQTVSQRHLHHPNCRPKLYTEFTQSAAIPERLQIATVRAEAAAAQGGGKETTGVDVVDVVYRELRVVTVHSHGGDFGRGDGESAE